MDNTVTEQEVVDRLRGLTGRSVKQAIKKFFAAPIEWSDEDRDFIGRIGANYELFVYVRPHDPGAYQLNMEPGWSLNAQINDFETFTNHGELTQVLRRQRQNLLDLFQATTDALAETER